MPTSALLARAVARRQPLHETTETNAIRLVHGAADGFPGLTVDRLGEVLLVEQHRLAVEPAPLLQALAERFGPDTPLFLKERWSRERDKQAGGQRGGAPHPPDFEITEDGLRFGVQLCRGEHIGFFLDARSARACVRALAEGRRVLNLFAYTGSLGVAAAAGGARATTNVDLMRSALDLGRENYRRNGLPQDSRTFLRNDVFQHLAHAARGRGRYDLVIVDPPPAARCRGHRVFRAHEDYPELVARALRVLAADGLLLAGHNLWDLDSEGFATLLRDGAALAEREVAAIEAVAPPVDFPADSDRPTACFRIVVPR